jgi:PAS domain S-box-containing protein
MKSARLEDLPAPSEQRRKTLQQATLRAFMLVGCGVSGAFALMFALMVAGPSADAALAAAAICGALALAFAVLMWPPLLRSVAFGTAAAVLLASLASSGVAAVMGFGIGWPGLSFVPIMLCAAAIQLTRRLTALLTVAHALVLAALATLQAGAALAGAPIEATPIDAALFTQLALLVAGAWVGILLGRVVARGDAAARKREQRFAGLLAVAADWYWETDAQLRFTHVTEPIRGSSCLPVASSLGRTPWEIEGFGLGAAAMDAHRADLESRQAFAHLLAGRRGGDERARWFSISGHPRFDERGVFLGYWGVGRDITAQRASELAREASETRYAELFARSPSPLVLHRDGRVLDANVAALALFGAWEPKDLIGRSLLDFYDTEDGSRDLAAKRLSRLLAVPIGEAAPPQQFSILTTAGRRLTVQVTSVKVQADGGEALLSIYRDETERQRSDRARERSEALLSHVVATSPDLITLTDLATRRYVMVNDAFTALSGYSREETIGRTAADLGVWPSDEARETFLATVQASGEVRNLAIEFRDRHGREVLLLVSAARFTMEGREYLVLNGRDVTRTERERLEREAILANASIGIAMTRDRVFQLANPAFEQMFGWPAGSLVGQPGDVISVDRAAYDEMGQLYGPPLARGDAVEFERMMKRHDGSTFLCRLLARPIDPTHPAHGGTIWIAEDVTDKRAVEQALARARDEAEAANRAKSAFLANTSHEIRTPLNGLVGLARLARQPSVEPMRREQYLAQIDDSAQALAGVISDILDLSKIEAGKLRLEQTDFDLHALLESIEHGYAALADARALALTLHAGGAVPRRVRGDPVRLRQILSNFLSNALKFTATGFVRLNVQTLEGPLIRFEVEDSGPGIAAEVQARLFEPFTQGDVSTTRRYGGTGLGLSICRELAQLMGGDVGMSSEPGRGSRFWAQLPLARSDEDAPSSAFAPLEDNQRRLVGLEVLVVEDNPVNMMIATTIVRQWGVIAAEAVNGADAVAAAMARADAGRPFDLVLMDVQMPVLGGHDATRALRRRFDARTLPIIALTAAALTSERDEALAAGMNDFLTKPLDAQRLQDALLRWAAVVRERAAQAPPVSTS